MNSNYEIGLLTLIHLLIDADGVRNERELATFQKIKAHEKISDTSVLEFEKVKQQMSEQDIYAFGINLVSKCTPEEKLRVFSILRRISQADGDVHTKEIKLLLYSLHDTGISYNDVVSYDKNLPIFN